MKCRYFCRLPLDISPVYLTGAVQNGVVFTVAISLCYLLGSKRRCFHFVQAIAFDSRFPSKGILYFAFFPRFLFHFLLRSL